MPGEIKEGFQEAVAAEVSWNSVRVEEVMEVCSQPRMSLRCLNTKMLKLRGVR